MKGPHARPLTDGERKIAASVYGDAIDLTGVTIRHSKWFPFQPRNTLMAPCGHVHVHPKSDIWSEDYSKERLGLQALLLHELCHVWQAQQRGKYYLPLMRHPFCRYDYAVRVGQKFERYGLEQQAEIVRHVFLLRNGHGFPGAPTLAQLETILPFKGRR
ncbi:MAG: vgr related protein [Pseudomonadota bacterium]|nr:vgr related protein [Pseudomonadota bacterium]